VVLVAAAIVVRTATTTVAGNLFLKPAVRLQMQRMAGFFLAPFQTTFYTSFIPGCAHLLKLDFLKQQMMRFSTLLILAFPLWGPSILFSQSALSPFLTNSKDVGDVKHAGSFAYDPAVQEYTMTGSGANIWLNKDAFHYAYRKLKGDFILQAQIRFVGPGTDKHRKIGWMLRENMDSDAKMAAATVHGDGLTALQYRKAKGMNVEEVHSLVSAPEMIQLERKGGKLIMSVARYGDPYTITSVSDVDLTDEVYAGIFICSHNDEVVEKAIFRNLQIIIPTWSNFQYYKDYLGSHIETMEVGTGHRTIQHTNWNKSLQAPNWTNDGKALLYNSEGLIYSMDLASKSIREIPTDTVRQNNNDHVISFDGKWLGLSSSSGEKEYGSLVYLVPLQGGKPRRITPTGPSYLHGFSPDGKWMTYTGLRKNEYDIYKIPAQGGEEIRLTDAPGLDDGSEYSPDGKYIYFNSVRSGSMQLWRMRPDGSQQEQITKDGFNNWFPHISPDGKWIAFISYTLDVAPNDHPFYRKVYLRVMPADLSAEPHVIGYLYGGQGTINTPSWSPDSRKIAFVSNSGPLPE
jgi:Tol biopolymer transport system component